MARKYPGNQHDTAEAMSHSVGTGQKNYHSLGLKDIQKARLTMAVSETLIYLLHWLSLEILEVDVALPVNRLREEEEHISTRLRQGW